MLVQQKKIDDNIENVKLPIINIKKQSNFCVVPINTLAISMSLFMLSLPLLEWSTFNSPIFATSLVFGGICQYIMGIFDWYQGRTIAFFIDFIFGLMNLLIFYSYELCKYDIARVNEHFGSNIIGTFFTLYLIILLSLLIACKNKGALYKINIGILVLSDIFILVWQFKNNNNRLFKRTIRKIIGLFLLFASFTIWFTGIGNFINNIFQGEFVPMLKPNL